MTARLDPTAELRKLAHTLGVDVTQLAMVADLPAKDLRTLREQAGEALFRADKHYFVRVAALSKTVPTAVAAKLTQAALPPLLAARTAELLEPARAADLVGRLSDSYLADVSAVMDASRSPDVIRAIPPERIAKVGVELARREEWIVIGGFVSVVTDEALRATVDTFTGEQLLRIGFVLDDLDRLDDIGAALREQQIDQLLAAAASASLWTELIDLLNHLAAPQIARLAGRYALAPKPVHAAYQAAVQDGQLPADALDKLDGA